MTVPPGTLDPLPPTPNTPTDGQRLTDFRERRGWTTWALAGWLVENKLPRRDVNSVRNDIISAEAGLPAPAWLMEALADPLPPTSAPAPDPTEAPSASASVRHVALPGGGVAPDPASVDDLEWVLRYGTPTRQDLIAAAGVIDAFRYLLLGCREERMREILRTVRGAR